MLWRWLRTLASGLVRVSKDFGVLLIFAGLVMNPSLTFETQNKVGNVLKFLTYNRFWFTLMEVFKTTFDLIKIFLKMKYNLLCWDKLRAKRSHATKWLQVLLFRVDVVIFRIIFKCSSCFQAARIIAKLAAWGKELMEGSDLNYYFNWIKTQLSSQVRDTPLSILKRM